MCQNFFQIGYFQLLHLNGQSYVLIYWRITPQKRAHDLSYILIRMTHLLIAERILCCYSGCCNAESHLIIIELRFSYPPSLRRVVGWSSGGCPAWRNNKPLSNKSSNDDGDGRSGQRGEPSEMAMAEAKKHFVFVHGSGHGAWCWYKVRCGIERSGHTATCIDLAGSGIDLRDPTNVASFEEYAKPLLDFMSALPDHAQVVLVGHSSGGLAVTRVLYEFSAKVAAAVYVCATMLRNGFSTPEDYEAGSPDMSEYGDIIADMKSNGVLKPEYQRMLLYNVSPPEDRALASMLLRPSSSLRDACFGGGEEVDAVRRIFVRSLHDMLLKPKQQDLLVQRWPPAQVFALESDHSPFFSTPDKLCDVLLKI